MTMMQRRRYQLVRSREPKSAKWESRRTRQSLTELAPDKGLEATDKSVLAHSLTKLEVCSKSPEGVVANLGEHGTGAARAVRRIRGREREILWSKRGGNKLHEVKIRGRVQ